MAAPFALPWHAHSRDQENVCCKCFPNLKSFDVRNSQPICFRNASCVLLSVQDTFAVIYAIIKRHAHIYAIINRHPVFYVVVNCHADIYIFVDGIFVSESNFIAFTFAIQQPWCIVDIDAVTSCYSEPDSNAVEFVNCDAVNHSDPVRIACFHFKPIPFSDSICGSNSYCYAEPINDPECHDPSLCHADTYQVADS